MKTLVWVEHDAGQVNNSTVQNSLYFLNSMANVTKAGKQGELSDKLVAQLNDYENKFSSLMKR